MRLLAHGILRDVGAMSALKAIRVNVRRSREILTVECACVRLTLIEVNVIGVVKTLEDVHRIHSLLDC